MTTTHPGRSPPAHPRRLALPPFALPREDHVLPFFQTDDQFPQSRKVRALLESAIDGDIEGAAALSAWTLAGAQCQASLTDGQVKRTDLIRHYLNPNVADRLARRLVDVGLWHSAEHDCSQCPPVEDVHGWVFHDWFQLRYDSADQVKESRRKRQELKDEGLLNSLWLRDCIDPADPTVARCRYCSREIRRADRKSPHRPVPDHVDPMVAKGIRNLVLACKECNQRKGRRTPAQAGMVLQPPPRATPHDPTSPLHKRRSGSPDSPTAEQAAETTSRPASLEEKDAEQASDAPWSGRLISPPSWAAETPDGLISPPHGAAETSDELISPRDEAAETPDGLISPSSGAAETSDAKVETRREEAAHPRPARERPDQNQNQSDPDLISDVISAGLVRARTHVRTAGSGKGLSSQGEPPQGQPQRDTSQASGKGRRRRGRGKKPQNQTQTATPLQRPQSLDAGDFPVEDPPGQFGSPWHNWRGRPPEDDETFCDAHGMHAPCRTCQSEDTP